jgi:hypothetical protein
MRDLIRKIKLARRITTDAFDEEIRDLIEEAHADLGIAGVHGALNDPNIRRAVRTYCLLNFGQPDNYDKLKVAYDEQKAQLSMATGYTDWGDVASTETTC